MAVLRPVVRDFVKPERVFLMRTDNRRAGLALDRLGAARMVEMAVRQPDLFDGCVEVLGGFQDLVRLAAGIHDRGLARRRADDGAVLLERRDGDDPDLKRRLLLCHGREASRPARRWEG